MDYKVKTRYVTATPRRARKGNNAEASATSSGGGGASISGGSAATADAHTHPNIDTLNQLDATPADGYLYLDSTDTDTGEIVRTKVKAGFADEAASADHATTADHATNADNADHATNADNADHATEASHAATADDLTQWGTADERYLSRQHDDTAEGSVTFRKATNFEASAQSPDFVSNGFAGSGWAAQTAEDGKTYVEADNLRIRGTLTAFELVIEKIRAICGALGISQACGRVKSVDGDATNYYLVLEGDDTHGYGGFQADDYIRCQRWTSNGARGYWVRVSFIGSTAGGHDNVLAINRSEFDAAIVEPHAGEVNAYDHVQEVTAQVAQLVTDDRTALITADDGTSLLLADNSNPTIAGLMVLPEVGDELVQYGNATDPTRQSAIYIHANGTGQPAIDLLSGITSKSFVGCLACRLGGYLPTGGFGLYAKNGQIISLSPDGQTTHYSLNPDGSFELGQGAIEYDGKGNVTIGNNVTIKWGAQSQTTYKWAVSDNGTSAPNHDWSSTFPTDVAQGQYIWKRTFYPDGTETTELIGFVGKDGINGVDGKDGVKGEKGDPGIQGEKGDQGIQGEKGEKGDKGDQGSQGEKGDQGDKGDPGSQGEKGDKGDPGPIGPRGDDGAAYYILAPVGSISRTKQSPTTSPSYSTKTITIEAYRTEGLTSKKFTGGVMKWAIYSSDGTTIQKEGTGDTVTIDYLHATRIEFKLFVNEVEVAQKTIPVVWNGTNGKDGKDGADGISLHSNLLVHTDFAPRAENYAGTWLNFRSSLATINGTLNEGAAVGNTDMLSASVSTQTDMFLYDVTKLLSSQTWYVIGITMRGTGTATVYCYPDTNEQTIYVDGGAKGSPSDASAEFALTSTWRRHYIAFCTKSSLSGTKYVLVRLASGSQADISMVTLGRPYEGGSALTADGYIKNDAQLIRMATPSNMETFCGINSLCTWRSSERDFDFYSQSLGSTIMSGQWYTLSFYSRGSGSINTYVYDYGGRVLSDASADMPMADGVKETTFDNGGSHTWQLTSEWVRHIYTFRVRTDGSYASPILLFRATIGTSGDFIAINQVKLEMGKTASDWCLNEMDKKAVSLPDWMKAFNGYTMSGDNYIASGNAFFGKKEEIDNTYTGCFMSSNGLQIGGNTVVGLYALDHNILKVAIDPVHQQYYFKGKVYADEGVFKGTIYADQGVFNGITTGMQLNSVTTIDTTNYTDYLELRTHDVTGPTTAKNYTKYAYPIIPNLSTIIYVNSLPETVTVDESTSDTKIKVTKKYRSWQLPPYGTSDDEIQQALSLVGCKFIIYNNMKDSEELGKGFYLYGRFFKTGETDFTTYLTLGKGMVVLTMCIDSDGQFYWQYDGAIADMKFNATLKPGTGFQYKAEIGYPPVIRPNN